MLPTLGCFNLNDRVRISVPVTRGSLSRLPSLQRIYATCSGVFLALMLHAGWSKVPHYAGRKYLITLAADKMQFWDNNRCLLVLTHRCVEFISEVFQDSMITTYLCSVPHYASRKYLITLAADNMQLWDNRCVEFISEGFQDSPWLQRTYATCSGVFWH